MVKTSNRIREKRIVKAEEKGRSPNRILLRLL
jgi:hypothetical protein